MENILLTSNLEKISVQPNVHLTKAQRPLFASMMVLRNVNLVLSMEIKRILKEKIVKNYVTLFVSQLTMINVISLPMLMTRKELLIKDYSIDLEESSSRNL